MPRRPTAVRSFSRPLLPPKIFESLRHVPPLAERYGRGLVLLEGEKVQYFPVPLNKPIPQSFAAALATYKPEKQVVVTGDRQLSDDSKFSVIDL